MSSYVDKILHYLRSIKPSMATAKEIAKAIGAPDRSVISKFLHDQEKNHGTVENVDGEGIWKISSDDRKLRRRMLPGKKRIKPQLDSKVECYFGPSDDCKSITYHFLSQARECVYIQMFLFTDDNSVNVIRDSLANCKAVQYKIIVDDKDERSFDVLQPIAKSYKDRVELILYRGKPSNHNKCFAIDGKTVITGSINHYHGAEYGFENIVVIHSSSVAAQYRDFWEQAKSANKLR